jgi:gamma-glutamyltranspeptidase / glutathione hydrolase
MVVRSTGATGTAAPVELQGTCAMVTANSARAAAAGASILAVGGNAMDAAAATAFASGVVEPAMSGIAGRGYLVVLPPGSTDAIVIDGHERAPAAARPDMFRLASGDRRIVSGWGVETQVVDAANRDGHLAVAVPAIVPALALAHRRFGALPWHAVLEPAIELACEGFEVDETLAAAVAAHRGRLARFPATAAIFLPGGRAPVVGDRLVQADLGRSLRALAAHGPDELRDGRLARAVAAEVSDGGGILAFDDLRRIEPRVWSVPVTTSFLGHRILGVPDATGAVTLIEILNMIEAVELDGDLLSADSIHVLAEVFRAAFEDRRRYVDDGDHADVPFAGLTDKRFARARAATIDRARRLDELATVDPRALDGAVVAHDRVAVGGVPSDRHTTHFCAVDERRMVVSMTQSLVDAFGSGVVVPGTGVLLNSAMHNFNPVPGELGSIAPWKRAPHFGTPLVVLEPDGSPRLALGGGGGTKIVTGLVQVLLRVLQRGESLAAAIAAPRIHCDGAAVEIDARAFSRVEGDLRARGHRVDRAVSSFGTPAFARVNGIELGDGRLVGAADPFSNAGAAGTERA